MIRTWESRDTVVGVVSAKAPKRISSGIPTAIYQWRFLWRFVGGIGACTYLPQLPEEHSIEFSTRFWNQLLSSWRNKNSIMLFSEIFLRSFLKHFDGNHEWISADLQEMLFIETFHIFSRLLHLFNFSFNFLSKSMDFDWNTSPIQEQNLSIALPHSAKQIQTETILKYHLTLFQELLYTHSV